VGRGSNLLPCLQEVGIVGVEIVFTFPCGFIFRVIIRLNLIKPNGRLLCGSILLVQYLDRVALVGQVGFQWNIVFNNRIHGGGGGLQTPLELGYMEDVVHTGQS
jgi:hypothetical protein